MLIVAGGTQGSLMEMEFEQQNSKSSLHTGTAMPPPSQIASPMDTKMKVSYSVEGTTLNDESLGLVMLQWKLKVRVTVKTTKSITENKTDFFEQVQVLLSKMLALDPALRLFPLETTTKDISIHALKGLLSKTREKYIMQQTASKQEHIDSFLHIRSHHSSSSLKRHNLPYLKVSKVYMEEYYLMILEVQVGWLLLVKSAGVKSWIKKCWVPQHLSWKIRSICRV